MPKDSGCVVDGKHRLINPTLRALAEALDFRTTAEKSVHWHTRTCAEAMRR
jgi:hypothetical protein